jgi:hypothetical protein
MSVRALSGGDILTDGSPVLITGAEEAAQSIETRLKFFLGEWFLDISDGTPWFQQVLGKGGNLPDKEAVIKRRILTAPSVAALTKFKMDYDEATRRLSIECGAVAETGEAINVTIPQVV